MLEADCITSILPPKTEKIFIAYSGGVDSHVLLHLAALNDELKENITAVYVHHGLQVEADAWADHCQSIALGLGLKFKCLKVNIEKTSGHSLEELARDARYQAITALVDSDDVVLFAQHREDQMETVLLQLFRGAGVQGLSGMPLTIPFGKGLLCRPFLDVSKRLIDDYAIENQLSWVEDPSNKSNDFDRNFLRNQIVPKLKQKWPSLDKTVTRSARHCVQVQHLSEDVAKQLFSQICDKSDHSLNIAQLLELDIYKQSLVIRQWFKVKQLRMPSEKIFQGIINEVVNAKESANPEIRGRGYSIKRYRNKIFCLTSDNRNKQYCEQLWKLNSRELELKDGSKLVLSESIEGIPRLLWETAEVRVRFRQGAEKIRLPGREGRHTLKKLYQEKAIPPWQRSSIPLVYLDNDLVAVAGLWISADFFSQKKEPCYQVNWLNTSNEY